MVKFSLNVDYSMPRQYGIYPPPPIEYKNARAILLVFQCAPNLKKACLPPELDSIEKGFDNVLILEYPDTSIGPYNEALLLLNCNYKNKPGVFVFSIYVDDDVALTAGREIWGIPKKLAKIELSKIESNTIRGSVTRRGITILDINAEIMDTEPGLDPKEMFENLPFYNLKLIPDVANNSKPALRQLTETVLKIGKIHKQNGAIANHIKGNSSQYDISSKVLEDANKDLGGFYVEYDFTLPNGRVLED
ncbi:MAG: acetoacetate decarboxylase family protein [Promethearchaeota archaeon]|jgi:acetoacetate decarboxylase